MSTRQQTIGEGCLTWQRYDRQSDRYGSVWLFVPGTEAPAPLAVPKGKGTLLALVLEPRASSHLGDFARGLRQEQAPELAASFELGTGTAFTETENGITSIGVKPDDKRDSDWLNPLNLYAVHDSVVRLVWLKK